MDHGSLTNTTLDDYNYTGDTVKDNLNQSSQTPHNSAKESLV